MRDLEDEERIKAYMKAKMAHIKMYHECMNLVDGLDVEKFAELVRADEREACAKVCDAQAEKDNFEGCYANACAEAIRARSEKPPVKTYCGGKPNYCTPEVTPEVTGGAFVLDRGCWERGCVAYDERDGDGVTIETKLKEKNSG